MADFDTLATAAFAEGSGMEEKNVLWKAVFELEEWLCIARGPLDSPYPFATYLEEDKPVLLAFTDSTRARDYAIKNEIHGANDETPILALPSYSAVDYFVQFIQNKIWGVWFNPGEMGFYAPLEGLEGIKKHIENLR